MNAPYLDASVQDGKVCISIAGRMPSDPVTLSPQAAERFAVKVSSLAIAAQEHEREAVAADVARLETELMGRRADLARLESLALVAEFGPELSTVERIVEAIFDDTNRPVIVIGGNVHEDREAFWKVLIKASAAVPTLVFTPTPLNTQLARREAKMRSAGPHLTILASGSLPRTEAPTLFIIADAGRCQVETPEGNLFHLADKRVQSARTGKVVLFFDEDDEDIAKTCRQYDRARKFRIPGRSQAAS